MVGLQDRTILVDCDVVLDIMAPGFFRSLVSDMEEPADKLSIQLESHIRRLNLYATDLGHDAIDADGVPFDSRSTPLPLDVLNHVKSGAPSKTKSMVRGGSSSVAPEASCQVLFQASFWSGCTRYLSQEMHGWPWIHFVRGL